MSFVGSTHTNPTNMVVVIVPPLFAAEAGMLDDLGWLGPDLLFNDPATQVALEAVAYWNWTLRQHETAYPALQHLTWTTHVLGYDLTLAELVAILSGDRNVIVVAMAGIGDPLSSLWALGGGLPTHPILAWMGPQGFRICAPPDLHPQPACLQIGPEPMQVCTTVNLAAGVGMRRLDVGPNLVGASIGLIEGEEGLLLLRNLVLHEFGHCLGAGHTGQDSFANDEADCAALIGHPTCLEDVVGPVLQPGEPFCAEGYGCFDDHPTNPMSYTGFATLGGTRRLCLANLNMQSLAEGYEWILEGEEWRTNDGVTFLQKPGYEEQCLPNSMQRF